VRHYGGKWGAGPFAGSIRPGNGPTFHPAQLPRRERSALLFIRAEIGAVILGVKAGELDYPT